MFSAPPVRHFSPWLKTWVAQRRLSSGLQTKAGTQKIAAVEKMMIDELIALAFMAGFGVALTSIATLFINACLQVGSMMKRSRERKINA